MHAISPYMISVVDGSGVMQDLWNINGKSFFDYLKNIYYPSIKGVQKITQNPTSVDFGKNFIFKDLYQGTANSIAGVYQTGLYGFDSEIFDTVKNKVAYNRGNHQSDMRPFHFSFYVPKNGKVANQLRGYLLLYRINNSGIRGIVMPDLIMSFSKAFPGLSLRVDKVIPTAVVSSLAKAATIKKIRIIQRTLPADYSKPKRNTSFDDINWFLNAIGNKVSANSIFTIPGATVEKVKVEIAKGKKKRTVDVGNLDKISSVIEIDKPLIGSHGHIDAQFWLDEADSLADDLFFENNVVIPAWQSLV